MANIGNVTVIAGQAQPKNGNPYWALNIAHNGKSFNMGSQPKLEAFLAIMRAVAQEPSLVEAFEQELATLVANTPIKTAGGTRFVPANG